MNDGDGQYQNRITLARAVSRLLPEVFFQPVWIHFVGNLANYSTGFIQNLLHNLLPEQTQGDQNSKCQVMFMCAFLQSRLGDHIAALAILEQILKLPETHNFQQLARVAAWGACAMCVRQGDYQQAVHWLSWLQEKLKVKDEWVLSNILELFRQTLESQEQSPGTNKEFLDWLLRWGEWPLEVETTFQAANGLTQWLDATPRAGMLSRLANRWGSFWHSIRHKTINKPLPLHLPQIPIISDSTSLLPQVQTPASPDALPFLPKQPGLPSLAVYCLGLFRVYQDDLLIATWPSGKGKAIFKYMIANLGKPISKEVLMDIFWQEFDSEAARKNLYVAIYGLRQAFRTIKPDFSPIIFQDDRYQIDPSIAVWVDSEEFIQRYKAGQRLERRGMFDEAVKEYELAESIYQGDFLEEDLYEDWPIAYREGLKDSYLVILARLSRYYFEGKKYAVCIQLSQKILGKDDCREDAHRRLMRCYSRQGQRHLALRQYHLCLEALTEVLGVAPMQETISLYHQIRNGVSV